MAQVQLQPDDDTATFVCDDCGWEGESDDLAMISDIEERINPGCIVPAGQCPECGVLAYYADENAPSWTAQGELYRLKHPGEPITDMTQKLGDDTPLVDTDRARLACITLINAYAENPEDVEWSDVQLALNHAIAAFGLPDDFPEQVFNASLVNDEESDPAHVDYTSQNLAHGGI